MLYFTDVQRSEKKSPVNITSPIKEEFKTSYCAGLIRCKGMDYLIIQHFRSLGHNDCPDSFFFAT